MRTLTWSGQAPRQLFVLFSAVTSAKALIGGIAVSAVFAAAGFDLNP